MLQDQDSQKLSKAESARVNGAKSQGATTPDGKLRSADGNLKHGAYSGRVVMQGEDPEAFAALYACFVELLQPQDAFDGECVTMMANTRWRVRRLERALQADFATFERNTRVEARLHRIYRQNFKLLALTRAVSGAITKVRAPSK